MNRLRKFFGLSPRQHAFLLTAAVHLAGARLDFGRNRPKDIIEALRSPGAIENGVPMQIDLPMLSWAIRTAARAVPWRSDCLIQSMAADRWIRRHGIVPEFRLGVSPSSGGTLEAHAWIEVDGVVITGGAAVSHYEILIAS